MKSEKRHQGQAAGGRSANGTGRLLFVGRAEPTAAPGAPAPEPRVLRALRALLAGSSGGSEGVGGHRQDWVTGDSRVDL